MREIKFRAWDKTGMTFWKSGVQKEIYDTDRFWNDRPYKTTYLQYTGLKDKNDVEIYEGDIVICKDKDYGFSGYALIEFFDYEYRCRILNLTQQNRNLGWYVNILEISGNIYQNPELIK